MKTKAQASVSLLAKSSSVETEIDSILESQTWDDKDPVTWSTIVCASEAQASATRAAKAQAWETQAFEAQARASYPKQTSVLEAATVSVLKQEPLNENVHVTEKEESEALLTRPLWSTKVEYILAQMGYSVRPSSFWYFTTLWLHSGNCVFFIIYTLMMFLFGIPLLFLEMAAGQRMHQSSMDVWKIIGPWSGGVGYASFMVCFITGIYLNVVNGWILFYISQSFQFPVPWEKCPLMKNSSGFDPECARTTPVMYFWYRVTLKASDRIEDSGPPVFSLSLPFLVSWCLLGALTINGLKFTGKVMYVLVLVPYSIIICFLLRSLLLEGAKFGLQHLVAPKISDMFNISIWCLAGSQVLFTTGLGFGPVTSLASHMPQSNDCLSDAFVVALVNLVTLLLVIPLNFSVLGFRSTVTTHRCCEKNVETLIKLIDLGKLPPDARPPENLHDNPISIYNTWLSSLPQHIKSMVLSEVTECSIENQFLKIREGPSFAFLSFIEALSFLPGSVCWSIIFFLLMLALGLSTTIGIMQAIIFSLQDTFSTLRKHTKLLTVGLSLLMFLCGFFFTRPSGMYFIRLLNEHWTVLPIIIIIIFENMAVAWAYGARRFLADMRILLGRPISPIYGWLWCYPCPIVLIVLFVTILINLTMKNITYVAWDSNISKEVLRQYPSWGLLLVIALFLTVILPIPVYFVYCLVSGIPFRSKSREEPMIPSKSLRLSVQIMPSKDVQKEEILQGDKTKCQSTCPVTS
ncbi:orphan sodium- and chloride-dependent neurotransmitter transporter NTT5 [Daubentonia madagascariensis]|uniref:Orphan sodium- and chloride-dependent neurotransmitter transporter NTT5 n=1 Tax=Daubentonia madagascariensis TaxID=31869 RepID=A0ABD2D8E6_DAUMA